ncbi:ABC transporter permease [Pseudomonas gingeri]|uniref:ABC transporter permease n=1 Tax=Pseudomonas gingeri TaxID=117681 RepID=UPI0015A227DF|nr:ABC transporter permease [Pseudomonas gingeri]NWA28159.1 ABC transporter permease [Pseudomonas gingeri]NWD66630.1 ABC transporter permease [Pseudomonas gingeri]
MNTSSTVTPALQIAEQNQAQDSLKYRLGRAERVNKAKALMLVLPLLAFIAVFFLFPIANMLVRSVQNPTLSSEIPHSSAALKQWNGHELPDEALFATVGRDLIGLQQARQLDSVGADLNRVMSDAKSLLAKTARTLTVSNPQPGGFKQAMIDAEPRWGQLGTWTQLAKMAPAWSGVHYLAALDLRYDDQGNIARQPESRRIYVDVLLKTLGVALGITLLCMLLGYPLAYMLATLSSKTSNLLMVMVLLPFWTSLLVRTSAWIVILQSSGVLNSTLSSLGLIGQPLELMYNLAGTVIAMTHILLPFMVLPLYSVMKSIDNTYIRAAHSMGASSFRTFVQVYFPLSLPGLSAGGILVFILATGYYITPALVGGRTGQVISNFIAYHMQTSLNWGLACAIASILLLIVLVLYWIYDRVVGISNMKLG